MILLYNVHSVKKTRGETSLSCVPDFCNTSCKSPKHSKKQRHSVKKTRGETSLRRIFERRIKKENGVDRVGSYKELDKGSLEKEYASVLKQYNEYKEKKLTLDMSRGKPDRHQLDISKGILTSLVTADDCLTEGGIDCRNYGLLDGIPEAKRLFSELLEVSQEELIVLGNSSLNIMYDTIVRCMLYGVSESSEPWIKQGGIKFICPVPGYDRHFAICKSLGIEMITVPMTSEGPDMDAVESLVASDEKIKGIWCIPKYSNPDGVTYSDATVKRFAALKPLAKDFRVFWDNAYIVHDLYDKGESLLSIFSLTKGTDNENLVYEFASTSKISFPGSGVAVLASSKENIEYAKSVMTVQTIGPDKLNMLRHVKYFKNLDGIKAHMKLHAEIIRPKFEAVLSSFEKELAELDIASWTNPKGGYFISLNVMKGCAKRVWKLMKDAGVTMTEAGATYPYGNDPDDKNLRIAPTFPPLKEVCKATEILVTAVKLASLEALLGKEI